MKRLAIIGAGASGLAASIEAKRNNENISVTVFEKQEKAGKKILVSGNGRCNILNLNAGQTKYCGSDDFAKKVFSQTDIENDIAFFKSLGLYLYADDEGRMYPLSNKSDSVLNCLLAETKKLGVNFSFSSEINSIEFKDGIYIINKRNCFDSVIVCGGGKASPIHGSDGSCLNLLSLLSIKINTVYPALSPIKLKEKTPELKGIRSKGKIRLIKNGKTIASSRGELQFADYGISGIPAMDISGKAFEILTSEHFENRKDKSNTNLFVEIDSVPSFSINEILQIIRQRIYENPDETAVTALSGLINSKLASFFLKKCVIKKDTAIGNLSNTQIKNIVLYLKKYTCEIQGISSFNNAQVTGGGADTKEFNPYTMESFKYPGLFACGEILDLYGICGGFNLSFAFSSGRIAGKSAAEFLKNND